MAAPGSESMDRGSEVLKSHVSGIETMEIRQTRRGWCQECMGCEALTEFQYFVGDTQIGHSLEDTDCFCRMCCTIIHPFKMNVKELNTEASLLELDRPLRCCNCPCKCCCYQEGTITSDGQEMGSIKEGCYFCVPEYTIADHTGKGLYKLHQPTCCCGVCVNCFTEGNPCGRGCCKVPFHLYPYEEGDSVDHVGKILKKPKSLMTELLTDAEAFECTFPKDCSPATKATIIGSAILLNAIYFEGDDNDDSGD